MYKKLIPILVCLVIVLSLVFTACSSEETTTTTTKPAATTTSAPTTTTAPIVTTTPAPTTRTIVDLAGRTVTIPAVVNRVATSFPATNQMIYMLGAGDKIVATVNSIAKNKVFAKIYPRIAELPIPFGGAEINLEELILSDPDVCFMLPSTDAVIKSIEDAGIPVIITPGFTDADTLKQGVRFIAGVLGTSEEKIAEEFCDYYDQNLALITSVTNSIPEAEQLKAYYSANTPLNTEGSGTLPEFWMNIAGARNVSAEGGIVGSFKDINVESLLAWDPDFIICRDLKNVAAIMDDSQFANLKAVKNSHVYVNPKGIFVWCARSAEEALQILWAAKTFYPDKFPNLDVRQMTKEFYQKFYNYTMTEEDLNETLTPTS